MTTIVLISHDLAPGGVQRKVADVARCLTRCADPVDAISAREYSLHLLLQEGPSPDPEARALFNSVDSSVVQIRCRPRPRCGFLKVPFSLFCFWGVLTLRPQRIIGFLRGPGILAVLLRRLFWWRAVRVGISDDSFPSGAIVEQSRGAAHAALLWRLVHVFYSRADWVAVPTEAARNDLVRTFKVPAERVIVSRNWTGSAGSKEPAPPTIPLATAGSATIPDGGFDLIYVGRLAPVKNLSLFVEIVHELRGICPSVRAVIVGGGPELPALERQRSHFGLEEYVAFAGWQCDVTPWLLASRLFCITSHHEGLPIAALEAMASGLPVISTRYPGADELVQDMETGFLCGDRGEFVDRIVRCLTQESLRRDLGRRARTLVMTRYGQANLRQFAQLVVRG